MSKSINPKLITPLEKKLEKLKVKEELQRLKTSLRHHEWLEWFPEELRDPLKSITVHFGTILNNATLMDVVDFSLYAFLAWESAQCFHNEKGEPDYMMMWYGPLALKLATTPSFAGAGVGFSLLGVDVQMPNSQQVGLAMLAAMGLLMAFDFKLKPMKDWFPEDKPVMKKDEKGQDTDQVAYWIDHKTGQPFGFSYGEKIKRG